MGMKEEYPTSPFFALNLKKIVFESRISRIVMEMKEKYPTLPYFVLKSKKGFLSQESSL